MFAYSLTGHKRTAVTVQVTYVVEYIISVWWRQVCQGDRWWGFCSDEMQKMAGGEYGVPLSYQWGRKHELLEVVNGAWPPTWHLLRDAQILGWGGRQTDPLLPIGWWMCGITTDNMSAGRSCVKRSKIRVRVKTSANEYQERLYTTKDGLLCITLHVHSALIMSSIIQF